MGAVLDRARSVPGVVVHPPVAKAALVEALRGARVMLYRGDVGETFCLALAEAQALGVPAVVQPVGAVPERVIDGETGFVAASDAAFARHAVDLLGDPELWWRQQAAALARQRHRGWDAAAADVEQLLLPPDLETAA
jgi:glycosyltransferase involved in cell wall biosynthesis